MKRRLMSIAGAMFLFSAAGASVISQPTEDGGSPIAANEKNSVSNFGGIHLILGVGGSFLKNEIKIPDANIKLSLKENRPIGIFGFGVNKILADKFLIGFETLLDFTKTKEWNVSHDFYRDLNFRSLMEAILNRMNLSYLMPAVIGAVGENINIPQTENIRLKSIGFFPSLGLRFGYIAQSINTMIYFKVAGSCSAIKLVLGDAERWGVNVVPTVALGLEKGFGKKCTFRLEGEYRFNSKKMYDFYGRTIHTEFKLHDGVTVRALVSL